VASPYSIVGGLADAQRLARQAHVMAQGTEAFLSELGLSPGWACLDVGCGDGQVTIEMARVAGPQGHAVGVDIDADALELRVGGASGGRRGRVRQW
jgi:ubiquinone/menaquinone biosynthesis C-methylase UbiE